MAQIEYDNLNEIAKRRLVSLLDKKICHRGVIKTWREFVEGLPDVPEKAIHDGNINYNRRHFNRLSAAEQRRYTEKLNAQRLFWLEDIRVPKMIYDAVPGKVVHDCNNAKSTAA